MSARLLAVITPGEEATALSSMVGLVTIARAAEAEVRLAYFRDLPRPRVDRHDRMVADTDTEMARIERTATRALASSARVFDDVAVETVVRFGKPGREVPLEAEVYAPQIVVVFAAARGLLARFRSWALRRRLAQRSDSRLLVLAPTPRPAEGRAPVVHPALTPPAHLPARRE
jgi:hypothetical protein